MESKTNDLWKSQKKFLAEKINVCEQMAKYGLLVLQFWEGVQIRHMRLLHCILVIESKTKIRNKAHHKQSCVALCLLSY